MEFEKCSNQLIGFVDADWGSDLLNRWFYTGFCFKLSRNIISWESIKQKTVALSSTEAEYMALSEASKKAIYLRNLLGELTSSLDSVLLYSDSQKSVLKLTSNPMYHKRTKYIDVRHHFIKEAVENKFISIEYLQTIDMPADILTKALGSNKHYKFMEDLVSKL